MNELTLDLMTRCGSHQKGHFQLSSGAHSADYLQCALFLANPTRAEATGRLLATAIRDMGLEPEIVVAPAMGGLIVGHETARALDRPFIFTERAGSEMALRRGFAVAPKQRVVIIEDVVTTGKSTREVISLLESMGAAVLGMASMINRSGRDNPFAPLPYRALLSVDFATWAADECPLCRQGETIRKPGSRPVE